MSNTYIIADLKLYEEEQCRKLGFNDFDHMNSYVVQSWNRVVKPEDSVIIMGDIGDGTFDEMKNIISQLNGDLTITSKHIDEKFSKKEWRQIGIRFFWSVTMFNKLPDGREILYLLEPVENTDYYKSIYSLLIVDGNNPIEGDIPFKDIMLSADAARWGYSPLDTMELLNIYENMKQFAEMENTETRTDIKEEEDGSN